MTIRFRAFVPALMSFTCLAGIALSAPAIAGTAPTLSPSLVAPAKSSVALPAPHAIDLNAVSVPIKALLNGGSVPAEVVPQLPASANSGKMATAGEAPVMEFPVASDRKSAADSAKDSAAMAGAGICDAYFQTSSSFNAVLGQAYKAIGTRDLTTLYTLLPAMQAQLDTLTPYEIKPEVCNGNHVNAYTDYQYFEVATLRANGVATGMPADLPLVKQPDLNQSALAYAVGWTKFEQSDFDGALAAYGKGLAMFPHQHPLQTEYVATLLRLKRAQDVVTFIDNVFSNTNDLDDETRGTLFEGRGVGLLMMGYLDASEQSLDISLRYHYSDEVKQMLDQLRAVRAQAKK